MRRQYVDQDQLIGTDQDLDALVIDAIIDLGQQRGAPMYHRKTTVMLGCLDCGIAVRPTLIVSYPGKILRFML